MFDQRLAQAIQNVLSSNESRFTVNRSLNRLVQDYAIGTIRGKSVYFTDKDREDMRMLLLAKGYSFDRANLAEMERNERLSVTPNEKAGGGAVKKNRVSIKPLHGQSILLADRTIDLPDCCHLDADWTGIADQLRHACVIVVENYENFNLIHKTRFELPEKFKSPLVVYRGDANESRLDAVLSFLQHINLPVFAFVDADLAGINIAMQLPGLVGILSPDRAELERQFMHGSARQDLFYNQYPVYGPSLERMPVSHCCYPLWALIEKHKACIVQERWISSEVFCTIIL